MANIPIWPGSSSFDAGLTPFSFYDSDTDFQTDATNVADWCAKRLGYPLIDIELQAANFFTAFEEATNEYGKQLYDFQIINNFQTLEGNATGSNFKPYITTIGLYDDNANLLLVGKLAQPVRASSETDTTFVIRYDT